MARLIDLGPKSEVLTSSDLSGVATEAKQDAAKLVLDDTNAKVTALVPAVDAVTLATAAAGVAEYAVLDVVVNPPGSAAAIPASSTELAELLSGAYVAVQSPGYLPKPLKASVTSLSAFRHRFIVPVAANETRTASVMLVLGSSATCAYSASPATVSLTSGSVATATLVTAQMTGAGAFVEVARIQPYTSTASDSGDSYLATKVTTASGTVFHFGHYDAGGNFVSEPGAKVGVWTVPEDAASIADCEENLVAGSAADPDLFGFLKVLNEERIVDVVYHGDNDAEIVNKFVRFSPVWVKTTFETIAVPVKDANGAVVSSQSMTAVCRWFCDTQADADYHLHAAFVRYERDGSSFSETACPYAYISRYPINNANLTVDGTTYAVAVSQSDDSNEIGNTRQGFLDRCRAVNNGAITVEDPATGDVLASLAAGADSRAMGMIDFQALALIEDLTYLLFGINSQAALQGVSTSTTLAASQQHNGVTDAIAALGVKLGGYHPHSSEYNFNFLDIEGGTWSAPGCMFPNMTSVMERVTTTDGAGVPTSITRNRYLVAIDRADYTPSSDNADAMLAAGYRWVSFLVGNNRRVGMDDSQAMRDAKIFCADQTAQNTNYAGVDMLAQGSFPAAIANYSASATYSVGAYAVYDGNLWQCSTAVTAAESFDSAKWTLVPNAAISARNYYLVTRGRNRHFGDSLGVLALFAGDGLLAFNGTQWRSRLSLQIAPSS